MTYKSQRKVQGYKSQMTHKQWQLAAKRVHGSERIHRSKYSVLNEIDAANSHCLCAIGELYP